MQANKQPKLKKSTTFARLMKLVFVRNKLPLILVAIFMVISTIANVSGLNTIQKVLDEGLHLFETGSREFSGVMYLLLTMIMYYILNIVFTFMHRSEERRVGKECRWRWLRCLE